MNEASAIERHAGKITWGSLALIVIALMLLTRALPLDEIRTVLEGWITGLGWTGVVVFALIYIVATVLLLPGSILTLAAGAVFGLWLGTAVVSVSSVTGAALALLIGRYFAREKVRHLAEKDARFGAVDRAIAEGGWKIVAMLRLSPAIPFNLQNYLYGLTPIGLWTCVLTSWVAMLPGTFMYVYLGYVAKQAVAGDDEGSVGKTILLVVGLIATVIVTVYITKLAQKKLREQTDIEPQEEKKMDKDEARQPVPRRTPANAIVTAVVALVMISTAAWAQLQPQVIRDGVLALLPGPARVTLKEAYQAKPDGPTFDHAVFDAVLKKHVDAGGWVDYAAIKRDSADLDRYIASLADAPFDALGRDEKLALLINAYNAFTLRLIVDHYPVESIKDIAASDRWKARRWKLAGKTYSLDDIEHREIRPKFKEPRIHFALVCAAVGCPPLRHEAYVGARLDEQLEAATLYVHTHETWVRYDKSRNRLYLTPLYQWYGDDFEQVAGSVEKYVAGYVPEVKSAIDAGDTPRINWLDYEWALNDISNRRAR